MSFNERDKDYFFALLERQTRLLLMIVENKCAENIIRLIKTMRELV